MRISDWSSDVCSSDLTGPSVHSAGVAVGVATGAGNIAGPGVAIMNAVGRPVLLLIVPGRRARRSALWQSSAPSGVPSARLTPSISAMRSEEHTSELQSLMRISYAVFCLKKNTPILETTQASLTMHQNQEQNEE